MKRLLFIILGLTLLFSPTFVYAFDKNLTFTDDNIGEDFIITTDKKDYYTLGENFSVYFSITNTHNTVDDIEIVFSLGKKQTVTSLNKYLSTNYIDREQDFVAPIIPYTNNQLAYDDYLTLTKKSTSDLKNSIERKDTKDKDINSIFYDVIGPNETNYYRLDLRIDKKIKAGDEWFIEVFGNNTYGHLDPNNWIYEQDFETLTNGDLNSQDSWTADTNFDVEENVNSYSGDKDLKLVVSSTDFINATRSVSSISQGTFYISTKFEETSGTTNADIELYDTNGVNLLRVFYNGTDWQWLNSTGWGTLQSSPTLDTWYRIGIEWDNTNQANKYRVNINDGTWSSWENTTGSRSFSGIDTILLSGRNETGVGAVYFDLINPDYTDSEETGSTIATSTIPTGFPIENDFTMITGMVVDYVNASSTGYSYYYFHVPFFAWIILAVCILWIASRIIIEILIRLRR